MTKKLAFKFCGGCNPSIDRLELRDKILLDLEKTGWALVEPEMDSVQLLIIINGCPTACIGNGDEKGRWRSIVISGENVNTSPAKGKDICKTVKNLIP